MIRKIGYIEIDKKKFWLWANCFQGKKGMYAVLFFNIMNHEALPQTFMDAINDRSITENKKKLHHFFEFKYNDKVVHYNKLLGGRPCIRTKVYMCNLIDRMEIAFRHLKRARKLDDNIKIIINNRFKNLKELLVLTVIHKI